MMEETEVCSPDIKKVKTGWLLVGNEGMRYRTAPHINPLRDYVVPHSTFPTNNLKKE